MDDPSGAPVRVFVASSSARLLDADRLASAVTEAAGRLGRDIRAESWRSVLGPSPDLPQSIVEQLADHRFGIFVLAGDDTLEPTQVEAGGERTVTRGNVLFELGLWVGRHGADHALIVAPAEDRQRGLQILSDFSGRPPFDCRFESDSDLRVAASKMAERIGEVADAVRPHARDDDRAGLADHAEALLAEGLLPTAADVDHASLGGRRVVSARRGIGRVTAVGDETVVVRFADGVVRTMLPSELAVLQFSRTVDPP